MKKISLLVLACVFFVQLGVSAQQQIATLKTIKVVEVGNAYVAGQRVTMITYTYVDATSTEFTETEYGMFFTEDTEDLPKPGDVLCLIQNNNGGSKSLRPGPCSQEEVK
jgi:hypothetical protein